MIQMTPVSPQMKTITIEARPMWETKKKPSAVCGRGIHGYAANCKI